MQPSINFITLQFTFLGCLTLQPMPYLATSFTTFLLSFHRPPLVQSRQSFRTSFSGRHPTGSLQSGPGCFVSPWSGNRPEYLCLLPFRHKALPSILLPLWPTSPTPIPIYSLSLCGLPASGGLVTFFNSSVPQLSALLANLLWWV